MIPLVATLPYAAVFWVVCVWALVPEWRLSRRSRSLEAPQDAGSMRLITWGQRTGAVTAYLLALLAPFGTLPGRELWFWAGIALMLAGSLLRRHCFRILGPAFTAAVVVTRGQAVIERGVYRWVRHPSYTAGAMVLIGIALVLGNWLSLIMILLSVSLTFGYRVHVEERALRAQLGDAYSAYMLRTKRFVPWVI
ncbi:MAG: methyltransferase family protein [Terriglobales bacterium]